MKNTSIIITAKSGILPELAHSPPLPRASAASPPPLPPFRARLRVTLLWTSGCGAGALTCENRSSVASFLKA